MLLATCRCDRLVPFRRALLAGRFLLLELEATWLRERERLLERCVVWRRFRELFPRRVVADRDRLLKREGRYDGRSLPDVGTEAGCKPPAPQGRR